jgi:hypothetical protein
MSSAIDIGKMHFGSYYARQRTLEGLNRVLCKPLTQAEYMEGWVAVLPPKYAKSTVYNWNVTLAQLPPNLWPRVRQSVKEGKSYYRPIRNRIYNYSLNMTEQDSLMFELKRELDKNSPNVMRVHNLYRELKPHVTGWLMMRANQFITSNS